MIMADENNLTGHYNVFTLFKELAAATGIPCQTLINLYLRDCAASDPRLSMRWKEAS
jgi:hypothetical protein